jgi:hydroxypyruvate reductase
MINDALDVFKAAIEAVDPYQAVKTHLRMTGNRLEVTSGGSVVEVALPPPGEGKVWVVGAGKGTAPMAQALEELLGNRLAGGIICVKDGHGLPLEKVEVLEASHPVPDERGVAAGRRIAALVKSADKDDLVIAALSGGGSALLTLPAEGVSLEDIRILTDQLLTCGAEIGEINSLRKHLSQVKGGQLAAMAAPARVVNLALSDVVGDRLDVIASGPFSSDPTTFAEALAVLEHYGIAAKAPASVVEYLKKGLGGGVPDTPKPGEGAVSSVVHAIVGSNRIAVRAAAEKASALGYGTLILSTALCGEAREVGRMLVSVAKEARDFGDPAKPPLCILAGGETTVTLRGGGKGGRNQEMALAMAQQLSGVEGICALSGGTDGTDGPTDAAGGVVDGATMSRGEAKGLGIEAFLSDNDSYHYLDAVGALVRTGPTRTNVMDVQVLLIK